ncbi:MAG TPA: hypothetical protein VKM55_17655, partial [Candidatus Lokiarchaeia archaeon]|nr:hypothetical protein [Candidatus Lokiarchaeia archaeon]
ENFIFHLTSILKENCLYPTIEEQTKDNLIVRIACPGSDDIELTIHLSQWSLEKIPVEDGEEEAIPGEEGENEEKDDGEEEDEDDNVDTSDDGNASDDV